MAESLQNCKLNGSMCGIKTMESSTGVRTSWAFQIGMELDRRINCYHLWLPLAKITVLSKITREVIEVKRPRSL